MKRILSILSASVCIGLLSAGDFTPADGDVVRMNITEWIDVPMPDIDHPFNKTLPIVDLTKLEILGNFEISYSFISDSVVCESRPDSRREYIVTGDTLKLMTIEAHDVIIREENPPVWVSFPLTSDSYFESKSARKVLRHQRDHYIGRGKVVQGYAGACDVIMWNGDTIRNVSIHSTYSVCRYTLPRLLEYPDTAAGIDSTAIYIEEINSWYAPVSRYPLIQSWTTEVAADGRSLYRSRASAAVVSEDLPFESDRPVGADNRIENGPALTGGAYSPDCLTVDCSGPSLDIRYATGCDITMEMILADVMGHVYASMPRRSLCAGEVYNFNVNRSSLPPGEYILYINAGLETYTEKIPLR